ncbi:Kinesin-like protein KIN-4C [Glycine soja]|uniref:Kinesin-like protein KIN-4C n=1 Tax=Glycine soja TaxID=3848 RepID=A0A445GF49_GLYSO|nr:Kinesin-like protein KIN-4C [Glycine soja]
MSLGARNSRIFALEKIIATSSTTLLSMASHLPKAEEPERVFSGKGRWNQVHSVLEAKNLMNHLFNQVFETDLPITGNETETGEELRT